MGDDERLAALEAGMRRLEDIEEIKQLKGLYTQLVDQQLWDRWAKEILTDDFSFDSDAGLIEGRDANVQMVSSSLANARTVHHVHSPTIEVDGDTAKATWSMQDHVYLKFDGNEIAFRGAGFYHDEYVRTADGWRLRKSTMQRLSVDSIPFAEPTGA
jgi:hypothetical protein